MDLRFRQELKSDLLDLNLRGILLNPHGRICRTVFVALTGVVGGMIYVVAWGAIVACGFAANLGGNGVYLVGGPVLVAVCAAATYLMGCFASKRLHDMDVSAWHVPWLLALAAPGVVCWAMEWTGMTAWIAKAATACVALGLALLPGRDEDNRFGSVDYWG